MVIDEPYTKKCCTGLCIILLQLIIISKCWRMGTVSAFQFRAWLRPILSDQKNIVSCCGDLHVTTPFFYFSITFTLDFICGCCLLVLIVFFHHCFCCCCNVIFLHPKLHHPQSTVGRPNRIFQERCCMFLHHSFSLFPLLFFFAWLITFIHMYSFTFYFPHIYRLYLTSLNKF